MTDQYTGYTRFWMASSTVLLSLAVAAVTWLVIAVALYCVDWSDFINFKDEVSMWISSVITVVVFCVTLVKRWKSMASVKLHTLEIMIGVLVILMGAGYFYAGTNYEGGQMLGGIFEILLGMYLAATGLLSIIAGGLGWLAIRLSRE